MEGVMAKSKEQLDTWCLLKTGHAIVKSLIGIC